MSLAHVRICPVCETENAPNRARCACGALLTGVDFSLPRAVVEPVAIEATVAPAPLPAPAALVDTPAPAAGIAGAVSAVAGFAPGSAARTCPHADCAQPNPPGQQRCVYCNRSLDGGDASVLDTRPLPTALRDDYRIVDVFPATGSEADILLVELRATQERRVVKLYRRGLKPDFRLLEILAHSVGPTVVALLAHGVSDGVAYEVLEYIPGGTLQHFLAAGPVPASDVRAIVRDVASALTGIHAHRILHRDVKPDNILLRSAAPLSLALTDFGIASLSAATQHFTGGARTTRYAAPEVLTGVLDAESDWWSLGMIVLEAATGRHPFDGLTEQVMNHQLATRPVDVSAVYDDNLRRLCRGLLLRDPGKRFGGDEVRRWLEGDDTLRALDDVVDAGSTTTPYRIEGSDCTTVDELARALARHWDAGKRDLVRGQVGRWIEAELHDHNLARSVRDIIDQRDASDDRKLLMFLRRADSGLPPLWRGMPVTEAVLVQQAGVAVDGDDAAAHWLGSLHDDHVLALYAQDPALARLAQAWHEGMQRFAERWRAAQDAEARWRRTPEGRALAGTSAVDDALYGQHQRLQAPPEHAVNAAVLLAITTPAYAQALRDELRAGAGALGERMPWFGLVWQDDDRDPVHVLVAHRLLPLAREGAARADGVRAATAAAAEAAIAASRTAVRAQVSKLLSLLPDDDAIDRQSSDDVVAAVDPMLAACQQALDHDLSAPQHAALHANLDRLLMRGLALRSALAHLQLTEGITALFADPQRLGLAAMVAVMVLVSRNVYVIAAVFLAAVLFGVYRWYRRFAAQESVIKALRNLRLPARMFMRD